MSAKIIMTKGLPCSGKTTWAKEMVSKNPSTHKRVNKDELREMLTAGVHTNHTEIQVLKARDSLVRLFLKNGLTVIVDDTNFNPIHESQLTRIASEENATFEVNDSFLAVDVETCIFRNHARNIELGKIKVTDAVIRDMHEKYVQCKKGDTTNSTQTISTKSKKKSPQYHGNMHMVYGKPNAIICDLDGTLAIMGDRSPYDASNCHLDQVNSPVATILTQFVKASPDNKILFVSGRSSAYRQQTVEWLVSHFFVSLFRWELFMRSEGDNRKDSVIKREIFDQQIRDNYTVLFVLDDRDQVVATWRKELNLPCFQVAYGNF